MKGYAGDSEGIVVTCEDIYTKALYTHMHTVQDFQSNFSTVRYFCSCYNFCIPAGKRKVTENLDEVVRRSYISSHVQFQH